MTMSRKSAVSRRRFLSQAAALSAAGLALPQLIPSGVLAAPGSPGASDKIVVGVIGVGGRANLLIGQLPEGARIVAIADCFLPRCDETLKRHNAKWRVHHDYRKLLDEKEIDAVIVGTHDHGRVLPCIHACQAGKDIYAEKPLTLAIGEGKTLVAAVRKYKRVFQVGSQQRSMAMNRIACDFIRTGGLGKLTLVRGVNYTGPGRYEGLPEVPKPAGLNWDMWLGQTEMRPYNPQLQFGWMGWRDYSGGEMTNWGAHGLDQIQWACGMDGSGPQWIWPLTPGPNGAVAWTYPNGLEVRLDLAGGPAGGGIFSGPKGKIEVNRNKFTDPKGLIKDLPPKEEVDKWRDEVALWQAKYHMENWLDCIRTRGKPVADVEIGHRSISVAHLANICRELGRKLQWDPVREEFVDDAEANTYVNRPRRKAYELPSLS
jgi:predicted dehydrogenase